MVLRNPGKRIEDFIRAHTHAHHEPPNCEFRLHPESLPGGDAVARVV
jgi:hypothetical protein